LLREHFHGVMADDPDVPHVAFMEAQQQSPDAGPMNLYAEIVAFRVRGGEIEEVLARSEPDLHGARSAPAEDLVEIECPWLESETPARPELLERAPLSISDPAAAYDV